MYWPEYDVKTNSIIDYDKGRDYTRGYDSNKIEQMKIIENIIEKLGVTDLEEVKKIKEKIQQSRIKDITEYGRVVHAEMEALLMCARTNVSARGGTLYTTTFPCHNCAKHIIAAGIIRVIYIEPYPKSKAFDFHSDSITRKEQDNNIEGTKVEILPFVGIGPRKFFELFSISLGSGYKIKRKDELGHIIQWKPENARLRIQLLPCTYLDNEAFAAEFFRKRGGLIAEK